jgi:hypothetical protein
MNYFVNKPFQFGFAVTIVIVIVCISAKAGLAI